MGVHDDLEQYIAEQRATNPEFRRLWDEHQAQLWADSTRIMWSGTLPGMRVTAKAFKMSVKFFVHPRPRHVVKRRKPRNKR
jgi:hypothetical protein